MYSKLTTQSTVLPTSLGRISTEPGDAVMEAEIERLWILSAS